MPSDFGPESIILPPLVPRSGGGSVFKGLVLAFALAVVCSVASLVIATTLPAASKPFFALTLGIGAIQWAWLIPMYLQFRRKAEPEPETAKGLLVAGIITLVLNGAGVGALFLLGGSFVA